MAADLGGLGVSGLKCRWDSMKSGIYWFYGFGVGERAVYVSNLWVKNDKLSMIQYVCFVSER